MNPAHAFHIADGKKPGDIIDERDYPKHQHEFVILGPPHELIRHLGFRYLERVDSHRYRFLTIPWQNFRGKPNPNIQHE